MSHVMDSPEILAELGRRFAGFASDVDVIAGPELGAVSLAAATSMVCGKPFAIVRKATKDYGTAKGIEGEPVKGKIRVTGKPSGWTLDRDSWNLSIDPMQRELFEAALTIPAGQDGTVQLTGNFGSADKAALAFRLHGKKK